MEESLADLPPNILSQVLARLPIKSILICRSVCKIFLDITSSNPHFNSLHSSNTTQILLVQLGNVFEPSGIVHLVDSELESVSGFGEEVTLKPMFQIPKYPGKYFKKYCVYIGDENYFSLVNSCNGLLYFAERNLCERTFICNPITNEYTTLLEFDEKRNEQQLTMGLWFGFSPGENQYKILRIFSTVTGKPWERGFRQDFWAQIHTVGSCSWRDMEDQPPSEYLTWDSCSAQLNGIIHWLCRCEERSKFIIFFDLQKEKFGEIRAPRPLEIDWQRKRHFMSIGVLRGCLSVTVNTQSLEIWVMGKYGRPYTWTREFCIDTSIHRGNPVGCPLRPLKVLSNGKILMMWIDHALVCYDPKTKTLQFIEFDGDESVCKSLLFSPNFVPLKEALGVGNLTVQKM